MLPLIAEFSYDEELLEETEEIRCNLELSTKTFDHMDTTRKHNKITNEFIEWETIRLSYMELPDKNNKTMVVPELRYGCKEGKPINRIDQCISQNSEEMFFLMYSFITDATAMWFVEMDRLYKNTERDEDEFAFSAKEIIFDECRRFQESLDEERYLFMSHCGLSMYAKQQICKQVNMHIINIYKLVGIDRIHQYLLDSDLTRFYAENPDVSKSYSNVLQSFKLMITPLYEKLFYWLYHRKHLRLVREITSKEDSCDFSKDLFTYLYCDEKSSSNYFTVTQVYESGEFSEDIPNIESRILSQLQDDVTSIDTAKKKTYLRIPQTWAVYFLKL